MWAIEGVGEVRAAGYGSKLVVWILAYFTEAAGVLSSISLGSGVHDTNLGTGIDTGLD